MAASTTLCCPAKIQMAFTQHVQVMMEPDIKNMTLNEYLMYEGRHKDLERSYTSRKRVASERNRVLVYPYSDDEAEDGKEVDIDSMTLDEYDLYMATQYKKDSSFGEILYDLFRMGAENLRRMEHEVPNRCNEETDEENINVSTTEEIEEVLIEDVEIDEDHDVDHSKTKEELQWILAKELS
ncbi:hypothetical protein Tco_0823148 [Tanacetum coccineum]|uniref:Uncharacterized protein n=1 Tax=Tanacetum coccineum TaxID=301880 RepID=A0ABQ5ALP0_9ASTR